MVVFFHINIKEYRLHFDLSAHLPPIFYKQGEQYSYFRCETITELTRSKEKKKFAEIPTTQEKEFKPTRNTESTAEIMNERSRRRVLNVLNKGVNYTIAPNGNLTEDIVGGVDLALTEFDGNMTREIRQNLSRILSISRPAEKNLSNEECQVP